VGALWERYSAVVFSKLSPSTQRGYRYAWGKRVAPFFADAPIGSLTTLDVEVAFASGTVPNPLGLTLWASFPRSAGWPSRAATSPRTRAWGSTAVANRQPTWPGEH
jgi:hypothetical protein